MEHLKNKNISIKMLDDTVLVVKRHDDGHEYDAYQLNLEDFMRALEEFTQKQNES